MQPRTLPRCSTPMLSGFATFAAFAVVATAGLVAAAPAAAQDPIRIGEINSYKAQPAFLDPYRKGWELALEQVNAAGGINGRKLEVVSRDDGANPGDAVRVAEELVSRVETRIHAVALGGAFILIAAVLFGTLTYRPF